MHENTRHLTLTENTAIKRRLTKSALFSIMIITLSILLGMSYLIASGLSLKWQIALLAGFSLIVITLIIPGRGEGILIGLLVFTLPFDIDQILVSFDHMGGSSGLRIALVDIILILLFVNYLGRWVSRRGRGFNLAPKIFKPWIVLFILSILSYIASGFPLSGLGLLIEMIRCFAVFLVVANYFTTKKRIITAVVLMAIGVGIQGLVTIIQYQGSSLIEGLSVFGQSPEVYQEGWQTAGQIRAGGTVGGPNILTLYLVRALPILCALAIYRLRSWSGALATGAFTLGTIALVLTFSRMGWGGFVIAIGLLLLFSFHKQRKAKIFVFSLVFISITATIAFYSAELIKQRLFSDDYGAAYSRIPMMENSLHMIIDNPVFGVGINNYPEAASKYDVAGAIWDAKRPQPVHNEILLQFAEIGIIGGLVFCWLWAASFLEVIHCRRTEDRLVSLIASGVLVGMIAEFIVYQVYWNYLEGYHPFWVILGLCVGMRSISSITTTISHSSSVKRKHIRKAKGLQQATYMVNP